MRGLPRTKHHRECPMRGKPRIYGCGMASHPRVTPQTHIGHISATARPHADANGRTRMRYAIVTETYPPEVNGVALTVQGLGQGLRARGNTVDLIRPRQPGDSAGPHELLVRG